MKLTLTLEINDLVIGDDLRFPVVAALLRAHADDILRTCGSPQMYGARIAYGPHHIVVTVPNHDVEAPTAEPTLQREDIKNIDSWADKGPNEVVL